MTKENERRLAEINRQQARLLAQWEALEKEADEIEAVVFKKTTQRSPEWHGGCNR